MMKWHCNDQGLGSQYLEKKNIFVNEVTHNKPIFWKTRENKELALAGSRYYAQVQLAR